MPGRGREDHGRPPRRRTRFRPACRGFTGASSAGGVHTGAACTELRVNSGLTYGANCQVQEPRLEGGIVITTFTKTETTAKAIDMALDVLKRLGEKGITAEQLASVKAYVKGTIRPRGCRRRIRSRRFWEIWSYTGWAATRWTISSRASTR